MAGAIQVGDVIKFAELAWTVWNYGWASENNAGENYSAFGADVHSLHTSLERLEGAVKQAQSSLRQHGAQNGDVLGGDRSSLSEIIGDYEATLNECHQLLETNRRYAQTTGPIRNIEWNLNVMPQVDHLRGRIQMHNSRIQHVLKPFEIDLINNFHGDLVRRITGMHADLLYVSRNINTLIAEIFPEVARTIEQQSEQELCSVRIPDSLLGRLEGMFERCHSHGLDRSLTLQEMTDCFLVHFGMSTVQFQPASDGSRTCPPVSRYLELLKCQLLMDRIKNSNELRNPPRISHWPGYVGALEEELSQQCSRFHTELVAPDITNCEDEMLEFWPETERRVNKLQRTTGPPYGCLLDVSLAPESEDTTWRTMRLLREIGSDHRFRIIETCGYNDQPLAEDPKVVDFSIRTATLIPIYADPVGKKDTPPPPEMVLEENYMSYRYVFVDIQSLLLFQQAVTGFKVEYMESQAVAVFVRPGQEDSFQENASVQLWIPSYMREHPEASRGCDDRRPSSVSQESAAPNPGHLSRPESVFSYQSNAAVSCTSWSSSSSEDTIAVKLGRRAASTDYGVIRPLPRNPLLILFTKDPDSSRRSIVAITIDDETKPNPERCNCRRFRDCRITALEQRRGRSPMLRAKRLANRAKWDLLPLAAAPNWSGLFRVSILFPTVEARHRFGGGYCECSLATEGDVDACVSSQHQGLLGIARVYYRRQMVLWQEQRDNQREVDDRPGQIK